MRGASNKFQSSGAEAPTPRPQGDGDAMDRGWSPSDHPSPDQLSQGRIRPGERGHQGAKRVTVSRQKEVACEPPLGRNDGALSTSANATAPRTKPPTALTRIRREHRRLCFRKRREAERAALRALAKIAFFGAPI